MTPLGAGTVTCKPLKRVRGSERRIIRLSVPGDFSHGSRRVLIHDLSTTGLLIETKADIQIGEEFKVVMPESGSAKAKAIWKKGNFNGCKFNVAISAATVSAAILRSPLRRIGADNSPSTNESIGEITIHPYKDRSDIRIALLVVLGVSVVLWILIWALAMLLGIS